MLIVTKHIESSFNMLSSILFLLTLSIELVFAKTHTYHYNAEWISANPDGLKQRPVISFNGSFPLPIIEVDKNDRIELYLTNGLHNTSTSLHFHGLFQNHTNYMDGPQGVTQCPIPPGHTMLYNFTVQQSGTYWYHSHTGGQYSDGLRGMMVVHDKEMESKYHYDEELDLTISDWYHETSDILAQRQLTRYNPTGAEPVPDSTLFNDTRDTTVKVKPDSTYMIRIVNMAMMVSQYLFFEDHDVEIIEVDGQYTKPAKAKVLYLAAGQRTTVLLHTKKLSEVTKNFCIVQSMDSSMLDVIPKKLELTSINYLSYSDNLPNSKPARSFYDTDSYDVFDDFNLVPIDSRGLLPEADRIIRLTLHMTNLDDGINYAFFNNITYVPPRVPTLLTALTAPKGIVSDSRIYGDNTNTFILNEGEVVDLIIDNEDDAKHPLHMHGHKYQVISRSPEYDEPHHFRYENASQFPEDPCVRDTVTINSNGNAVLRFRADNPGIWFFHCHLDFHLVQGLAIQLVEAPNELRSFLNYDDLPEDYIGICDASGIHTKGNAAGNTDNWLDLTGQNLQPNSLPPGFTIKGYIAMAICVIAALLGLKEIVDFGMEDVKYSLPQKLDIESGIIKGLIIKLEEESVKLTGTRSNRRKARLDRVNQSLKELKALDEQFMGLNA